jgi:predicted 2-oxoglutarate/Fe(II)-dependent dioxygenase YbiX
MILIDKNSKVLNDDDMGILQKKCDDFILAQSPTKEKNNTNFYFRQFLDLKDPLMHNIIMGLESHIKTKLYTNLKLTSMWINKIDINSNKDDDFHKDTSPCSLILYLNDDYIGGELEYINDTNNRMKIIPQKNLVVIMNNRLEHRVLPITSGVRYSLVAFFGFMDNQIKSII